MLGDLSTAEREQIKTDLIESRIPAVSSESRLLRNDAPTPLAQGFFEHG